MIGYLVTHPFLFLAAYAFCLIALAVIWVGLIFVFTDPPQPVITEVDIQVPPLTWDELDDIDWKEFTRARKEWETKYRLRLEFEERLKESKNVVHYLPEQNEWKWTHGEDEAA